MGILRCQYSYSSSQTGPVRENRLEFEAATDSITYVCQRQCLKFHGGQKNSGLTGAKCYMKFSLNPSCHNGVRYDVSN